MPSWSVGSISPQEGLINPAKLQTLYKSRSVLECYGLHTSSLYVDQTRNGILSVVIRPFRSGVVRRAPG